MNNETKNKIIDLKKSGLGYKKISKELGIPLGTVKSTIKRYDNLLNKFCKSCGKKIFDTPGKKTKVFCSDKCRMNWWNTHQDEVHKKANYEIECINCGKLFISYGNKNRKYCSRKCYLEHRYYKG